MSQTDLFSNLLPIHWEEILPDPSPVKLMENFLDRKFADYLFEELVKSTPWRQDKINIFGKAHNLPRLQQWYGDDCQVYRWSGIEMQPLPWTGALLEARDLVQSVTGQKFNSVLLNYYRNGDDTVGWHADDESGLGPHPFIASLSLGTSRDFMLRANNRSNKIKILLCHGSLLTMAGKCQTHWQHGVPRRKGIKDSRINLTFRKFDFKESV